MGGEKGAQESSVPQDLVPSDHPGTPPPSPKPTLALLPTGTKTFWDGSTLKEAWGGREDEALELLRAKGFNPTHHQASGSTPFPVLIYFSGPVNSDVLPGGRIGNTQAKCGEPALQTPSVFDREGLSNCTGLHTAGLSQPGASRALGWLVHSRAWQGAHTDHGNWAEWLVTLQPWLSG